MYDGTGGVFNYGSLNGGYSYAQTFYNSVLDIESAPSISEMAMTNSSHAVRFFKGYDNTYYDKVRIYRLGGILTEFTLLDEINNEL